MEKCPTHLIILLIPLVISCSGPSNIVQIEPGTQENMTYFYGKKVQNFITPLFNASINFEDHTKKELIFFLRLDYTGPDTILLNPIDFKLIGDDGVVLTAFDPESHILSLKLENSRRESTDRNLATIEGTLNITQAIAGLASGQVAEYEPYNNITINNNQENNPLTAVTYWQDITLRKTTLYPGLQVEGSIVFPRNDKLRQLTLQIPVGKNILRVPLRQRIFLP